MLVEEALKWTNNLTNITADVLRQHPDILPMLRMTAAPLIARDCLIGLTGVSKNLVGTMEAKGRLPSGMSIAVINRSLQQIGQMIIQLADRDLFTWLDDHHIPTETELYREATKFSQIKRNYGKHVCFVMLLCGYFDVGYLKYEAAEGIDWVWEHRIDDLAKFGV